MKKFAILFCYLILSVVVTWPLVFHLNDFVIDRGDGLLNTWMLNWISHIFSSGPLAWPGFYNANIFYPYHNTFAFSDLQLPLGIIATPFILISGKPLVGYNVLIILGLTMSAFSGYLLSNYLTKKTAISFFIGILVSFSTIHLNYITHQQAFQMWPIILALLFLMKHNYKLFVAFFLLSTLSYTASFYILLFILSLYAFYFEKFRLTIILAAVCALISAPFLIPYFLVSNEFHYVRPISDTIHFSLQFPDLVNIGITSRLSLLIPQMPNSTPAYFGGVFVLLAIFLLLKPKLNFWILVAGTSFVLALGPALHIFRHTIHVGPIPVIPLPYTIFYYLIPGFSGFRTPSRWILVVMISLAIAIGVKFKRLSWFWSLVLSTLVLVEVNFPFHYYEIPKPPPEQIWLKSNYVGAPIIQFPIYGWFDGDKIEVETLREYYSTIHWHPMFNGYSGYSPTEWENKVRWLQKEFPSVNSVTYLRNLGIKLVLAPSSWQIPLKLVATFPETKIYEIY